MVGLDESEKLRSCLPSLGLCSDVVYVDLGSNDDSVAIAVAEGAGVIRHERVQIVEEIHSKMSDFISSNWVMLLDPDEVIDPALASHLQMNFGEYASNPRLGAVYAPWIFYFKKKRLSGTPWGGENYRLLLANRQGMSFEPRVHSGRTLRSGYDSISLPHGEGLEIHHFWMSNYTTLLKKHLRYLKQEGSNFIASDGILQSIVRLIACPTLEFRYAYFTTGGWRDGPVGFFLSLFWAWYQTAARLEKLKALRRHTKLKGLGS